VLGAWEQIVKLAVISSSLLYRLAKVHGGS
jgi:hypothetical protein